MWLHHEIKSLADIVRYYGARCGTRTALIAGNETRTFGELDRDSNHLARLIASGDSGPDATVAFLGKNSIAYFETLFGVASADAGGAA